MTVALSKTMHTISVQRPDRVCPPPGRSRASVSLPAPTTPSPGIAAARKSSAHEPDRYLAELPDEQPGLKRQTSHCKSRGRIGRLAHNFRTSIAGGKSKPCRERGTTKLIRFNRAAQRYPFKLAACQRIEKIFTQSLSRLAAAMRS